jgi:hypothetical protein
MLLTLRSVLDTLHLAALSILLFSCFMAGEQFVIPYQLAGAGFCILAWDERLTSLPFQPASKRRSASISQIPGRKFVKTERDGKR